MTHNNETIDQKPDAELYGKVMGILQNPTHLDAFIAQLGTTGVGEVTTLRGPEGAEQLESWKASLAKYFFGDMEMKMLQLYLDAVAMDLIIFVVDVESDIAEKTAELAKSHGAVDVVHFGNSVVTNY
jgi:hypothetical protein